MVLNFRPHPAPGRKLMFKDEDPRLKFIVPLDPRIHFALVCGAKSCPAIRVYKVTNLERGLQVQSLDCTVTRLYSHYAESLTTLRWCAAPRAARPSAPTNPQTSSAACKYSH
jgi:hypothetical protein